MLKAIAVRLTQFGYDFISSYSSRNFPSHVFDRSNRDTMRAVMKNYATLAEIWLNEFVHENDLEFKRFYYEECVDSAKQIAEMLIQHDSLLIDNERMKKIFEQLIPCCEVYEQKELVALFKQAMEQCNLLPCIGFRNMISN